MGKKGIVTFTNFHGDEAKAAKIDKKVTVKASYLLEDPKQAGPQ